VRTILAPLAILLLCACAAVSVPVSASGEVRLGVEPQTLSAGDTLVLVLSNDSSSSVFYNLCHSVLERRTGERWEQVTSDRICTMELRTLEPGRQVRYPLQVPPSTSPGEYRYATRIEEISSGWHEIVRTMPFRVSLHD
jgi:hypothetical protein